MFALFALMLSLSVVSAGAVSITGTDHSPLVQQDKKVKIKPEDLPDAVKTTLNSDDYKDWEISAAYKHEDTEIYEVELKSGAETKTLKFDKDGNQIS